MIKALIHMTVHSAITESDTLRYKKSHQLGGKVRNSCGSLGVRAREEKSLSLLLAYCSSLLPNRPKVAISSSPAMDTICWILLNSECWELASNGKGSSGNGGKPVAVGFQVFFCGSSPRAGGFMALPGTSSQKCSYGKGNLLRLKDLISLAGTWKPEAFIKLF